MNAPIFPPPVTSEDRIPHDQAVWRADRFPTIPLTIQVSVDYGDGLIEQTTAGRVVWGRVALWRFGWATT